MPLTRGKHPLRRNVTGTATERLLREPLRSFSGRRVAEPANGRCYPSPPRRVPPRDRARVAQWIERRPPEPSRLSVVATRVRARAKWVEFYALRFGTFGGPPPPG